MKLTTFLSAAAGAGLCLISSVLAQGPDIAIHGYYTEPNTGMTFYTSSEIDAPYEGDDFSSTSVGGFTFGIALPPNALTVNSNDYIGLIIGSTPSGKGWSGIVQGDNNGGGAAMLNHAYALPAVYKGSATLSQIYSNVNATHWTLIYKCTNCFKSDDPTQPAPAMNLTQTTVGFFEFGWAQSTLPVNDVTNPNSDFAQHDNGQGEFVVQVASATQASYSKWATMTTTATGSVPTGSTVTTSYSSIPVPTGTYDYVIVGGGAGGIPMADKLSASGKSVLLVEKGVASSARWGGTLRPESGWLDGSNQTWFDVPGECNRIWNGGATGVACADTDQMAGCILGGGTAVNAGLWWKPNTADWDFSFPTGWKSTDMVASTNAAFARIPGTDHPSKDGKLYIQSGFNVLRQGLASAGWANITANDHPEQKNRTFAYTTYMSSNGERGGPLSTYLVTANGRSNFHMWLNTSVEKIVRVGGHATGLNVIPTNNGGHLGTVNLTPITGRVIISAGAFGTPKLLFRSGIGPADQLAVVKSSTDGPTMINSTQYIITPVGYNLDDHLNTDCVVSHPNISYYDWVAAWNTPNTTDATNYLTKRIGPLTQAAPNIGPMMWEVVKGPDGIQRQMQWTSRVEGSSGIPNGNSMTLSLYLGRGSVSRGRTTISQNLQMSVSTLPYGNTNDLAAVATAIDHMVAALKTIPGLVWNLPPIGMTGAQYLASIPLTTANIGARRSNHWLGTCKMGLDSGVQGGTSVVDTNTKVYGTDNIFVVDASIFPGMPSTNPSGPIVVAAERASSLILALPANVGVARYAQCGGQNWAGSFVCAAPYSCVYMNAYYSQCL